MTKLESFYNYAKSKKCLIVEKKETFLGGDSTEYSLSFYVNEYKLIYKLINRRSYTVSSNNNRFTLKSYVRLNGNIKEKKSFKILDKKLNFLLKKKFKTCPTKLQNIHFIHTNEKYFNEIFSQCSGMFEYKYFNQDKQEIYINLNDVSTEILKSIESLLNKIL